MKKMFSLNCAAFVAAETNLMPEVKIDDETGSCFFVFPEVEGVKISISRYKGGNPLIGMQDFLRSMKYIRTTMQAVKEGVTQNDANK